jgi:Ca2+-binding RTX toxin-like protein
MLDQRREARSSPSRVGSLIVALLAGVLLASPTTAEAAEVMGSSGSDRLTGTAAADLIFGREGDDGLRGRAGDDRLVGGPGDDLLKGGPGQDTHICGPGWDVVVIDVSSDTERIGDGCEAIIA